MIKKIDQKIMKAMNVKTSIIDLIGLLLLPLQVDGTHRCEQAGAVNL
jgi:hypothetical protein